MTSVHLPTPTSELPASGGERRAGSISPKAGRWPLERVLFALAGTITAASAALAVAFTPWFLVLTAFVAVNQLAYALVGVCGASIVLRRFAGLESALYPTQKGTR